jgi:hypothetical protein
MARIGEASKIGLMDVFGHIFKGAMPALYDENPPELADFYRSYLTSSPA